MLFTTTVLAAPVQWLGNGHWYDLVLDNSSSWDQADAIAASRGGYLATITSSGEQSFIESMLSASACPSGGYWIGLRWITPNVFGWANGEALSYTHWGSDEPNNGWGYPEDRGQINWTSDADSQRNLYYQRGTWNDIRNLGWSVDDIPPPASGVYDIPRTGFIIEMVPEPATTALTLVGLALLICWRWLSARFSR